MAWDDDDIGTYSVDPEPEDGDVEAKTVVELRDELRSRGLPTAGSKAELVARLQGSTSEKTPAAPEKVEVRVGGHVIMADPVAPTPPPIETCSVCGHDPDECPHGDGGGWTVEDGV